MTETVGHGKGSLLIHTRNFVAKTGGDRAWQSLVDASPAADRALLTGIFLAGSWYPIGVINRVVERYCKASRMPDDTMRELSAYIADNDLGTVYKMALRLGSPDFLIKRTGSLWNRYFDVGELTPSPIGAKHWELRLAMPCEEERAPNRFFCGPGCPAWIEMGLRLTGASHARVNHVGCRYDKAGASCVYDVTW